MNFARLIAFTFFILITFLILNYSSINAEEKKSTDSGTSSASGIQSTATTILVSTATGFGGAAISYFYNNKQAEQNSRRSYEYDARKRLYTECEPIIFQIIELSDWALKLIEWLAEETSKGTFDHSDPKKNYFIGNKYMMRSTIYRLLSPLAAFRILQSVLTTVDLRLDHKINLQYMLAKKLYLTFTKDDDLAKLYPELDYKVIYGKEGTEQRKQQPQKYRKQGFNFGRLDKLTSELMITDSKGIRRVITYDEFERKFESERSSSDNKKDDDLYGEFTVPYRIFYDFHPNRLPVLWRILLTQARIYNIIKNISKLNDKEILTLNTQKLIEISKFNLNSLCWNNNYNYSIEQYDKDPDKAVEKYLRNEFDDVYNTITFHNVGIKRFINLPTSNNESNSNIGFKDPLYYCKQHPHIQNIRREAIESHIQLYSRDHQSP